MNSIKNIKEQRLTLDEERDLVARAQAGESEAFEPLLACYIGNVRAGARIAARTAGVRNPLPYDDALSAAYTGFIEAVLAVDLSVPTYRVAGVVQQYIWEAVSEAVGDALPVTIPNRTLKRYFGIIRRADGDVNVAVSMAPTYGMSIEVFLDVHSVVTSVDSLDAPLADETGDGDDDVSTLHDSVAARLPDVDQIAANRYDVALAFTAVDETEKQIVRLAYGFEEYGEPIPDAEIGHRIGMTRPTVQRRRVKAISKMRDRLAVDVDE